MSNYLILGHTLKNVLMNVEMSVVENLSVIMENVVATRKKVAHVGMFKQELKERKLKIEHKKSRSSLIRNLVLGLNYFGRISFSIYLFASEVRVFQVQGDEL